MTKLKSLEWTDALLLVGAACALLGLWLLWGEGVTLLVGGLALIAVSALADLRMTRR